VVLSVEERVFLVEYTNSVHDKFAEKFPESPVPHRNAFHTLIVKLRETGSVLDAERRG
jgi:hypothetical protein